MKKIVSALLLVSVLFSVLSCYAFDNLDYEIRKEIEFGIVMKVSSSKVFANLDYQNYDKNNPEVKPYLKNNRLMVPVRFVAESFNQNVNWDASKNWVHIADKGWSKSMIFKINDYDAIIFGKTVKLDACAELKENRAFLPLRVIVESLGKQCYYQDGIIIIRYEPINSSDKWVNEIITTAQELL